MVVVNHPTPPSLPTWDDPDQVGCSSCHQQGFGTLHAKLQAYRPRLQQWFDRVLDHWSHSPALLRFLWEPISTETHEEDEEDDDDVVMNPTNGQVPQSSSSSQPQPLRRLVSIDERAVDDDDDDDDSDSDSDDDEW